MIRRYGIKDAGRITKLMRREWEKISDDSFSIDGLGEHVYQICTRQDIYAVGDNPAVNLALFFPLNHASCQIHVIMTGENKIEVARDSCRWMYRNTKYENISAMANNDRRDVKIFAAMCGMRRVGILEGSFKKDGVLHDQVIYQCTREDYERELAWQQQ